MCEKCNLPLSAEEKMQAELYKAVHWGFLYGAQGMGKNLKAAEKIRKNVEIVPNALDSRRLGTGLLKAEPPTKLPQKVCNYRKPKVEWYGAESSRYSMGTGSRHWVIKNYYGIPGTQHSMWPVLIGDTIETGKPMGTTTGRFADADPLKGRRFVGIAEVEEFQKQTISEKSDQEFFASIFGDVVAKRLYDPKYRWEPKGQLTIMSGKPPKINEKSKETIERVERIEYPEV